MSDLDQLLNTLVLPGEVWDEREGVHWLGKRALAEITRLRADIASRDALLREAREHLPGQGSPSSLIARIDAMTKGDSDE